MARKERTQLTVEEQREKDRLDTEGYQRFKAKQKAMGRAGKLFNWDYARKIFVIIATMLLAAGRTAMVLFTEALAAAQSLIVYGVLPQYVLYFALAMAFLSLLAVEGYIVNTGIDRGKQIGLQDGHGNMIKSAIPSKYALMIAVAISMLAGLGFSIAPVKWLESFGGEWIRTGLGLVVGIGVSILAYSAGEDLGAAMRRDTLTEQARDERLKQAWLVSRDRRQVLYRYLYEEVEEAPAQTMRYQEPQITADPLFGKTREIILWYRENHPGRSLSATDIVDAAYKKAGYNPTADMRMKALQRVRTELSRSSASTNGAGRNGNGHGNNVF